MSAILVGDALTAIGIAGQASIDKVAGPVGEALIMTASTMTPHTTALGMVMVRAMALATTVLGIQGVQAPEIHRPV